MKFFQSRGFVFCLLLAGLFTSCKRDKDIHFNMGYGYAPQVVGSYIIYDVDSTIYSEFNHDTIYYKYQLKELVESVFPDNQGRPSLRIERYIRNYNPNLVYDSIPWTLKNVWYSTITATDYERVESNQRYVKLIFPPVLNVNWNGNAQNTMGDWEYSYFAVNIPQAIGTNNFDSTAIVIQKDETNLLDRRYYKEIYAKKVGLIFKQIFDVYDTNLDVTPVITRIKGGVYYAQTIHSYGHI